LTVVVEAEVSERPDLSLRTKVAVLKDQEAMEWTVEAEAEAFNADADLVVAAEGDAAAKPCLGISLCDASGETLRGAFLRRNQRKMRDTGTTSSGSGQNSSSDPLDLVTGQAACPMVAVRAAGGVASGRAGSDERALRYESGGCLGFVAPFGERREFLLRFKGGDGASGKDAAVLGTWKVDRDGRRVAEVGLPGASARAKGGGGRIYLLSVAPCVCTGTPGSKGNPLTVAGATASKGRYNVKYSTVMLNGGTRYPELGWEEDLYPAGALAVLVVNAVAVVGLAVTVLPVLRIWHLPLRKPLVAVLVALALKAVSTGMTLLYFRGIQTSGLARRGIAVGRLPFMVLGDLATAAAVMMMAFGLQFVPASWRKDGRTGVVHVGGALCVELALIIGVKLLSPVRMWFMAVLFLFASFIYVTIATTSSYRMLRFLRRYSRAVFDSFVHPGTTPIPGLARFFAMNLVVIPVTFIAKLVALLLSDFYWERPDTLWIALEAVDSAILVLYGILVFPRPSFGMYADMGVTSNTRLRAANVWRAQMQMQAIPVAGAVVEAAENSGGEGEEETGGIIENRESSYAGGDAEDPEEVGAELNGVSRRRTVAWYRRRREARTGNSIEANDSGSENLAPAPPATLSGNATETVGTVRSPSRTRLSVRGRATAGAMHANPSVSDNDGTFEGSDASAPAATTRGPALDEEYGENPFPMRDLTMPRFSLWRTRRLELPAEWIEWHRDGSVALPNPTRGMWRGLIQSQLTTRARRAVGLEKPPLPSPPVLLVGLPREGRERESVLICMAEAVEGPRSVLPGVTGVGNADEGGEAGSSFQGAANTRFDSRTRDGENRSFGQLFSSDDGGLGLGNRSRTFRDDDERSVASSSFTADGVVFRRPDSDFL
jgi:hypothetical protein